MGRGGAIAALLWAVAATAFAGKECAECHADPELAKDGTPQVSLTAYAASVHGAMECGKCHQGAEGGFDVVPHDLGGNAVPRCVRCHGLDFKEANLEFKGDVHVQRDPDFGCGACHDAHTMPRVRPPLGTQERTDLANRSCLHCHRDADFRIAARHGEGTPPKTTHDWLPNLDQHARMRCVVCHTPVEDSKHDHQILPKEQAVRRCEACHSLDAPLVRKYVGEHERRGWITHPVLFDYAYLPGTVRNRLADTLVLACFGLTVVGVLAHALVRLRTHARLPRTPYEVEATYLYPLGLRLWHGANAALVIVLAATGLRLHFGGQASPLLSFETAFHVHNLGGLLLVGVALCFYVHGVVTRNARQYLRRPQDGLAGLRRQARYYLLGIFRGEPHPYHATPERKFNPLQQVAYAAVMYGLFPILILSGAVLLVPGILPDRIGDKPGVWWFATAPYLSAAGVVAFLLAHLYLATTGDRIGYLFRAMLTGWHKQHVPKAPAGPEPM